MLRLRFWHFLAASVVLALFALGGEAVCWMSERSHSGSLGSGTASAATATLVVSPGRRVAPGSTARRAR